MPVPRPPKPLPSPPLPALLPVPTAGADAAVSCHFGSRPECLDVESAVAAHVRRGGGHRHSAATLGEHGAIVVDLLGLSRLRWRHVHQRFGGQFRRIDLRIAELVVFDRRLGHRRVFSFVECRGVSFDLLREELAEEQ